MHSVTRLLALLVLLGCSAVANAQMTENGLHDVIIAVADEVVIDGNVVRFSYDGVELMCISDARADRMRIVSPIGNVAELGPDDLELAMQANFHSALDARYAIMDGVVFSAYIHPLSPLTRGQIISAIRQVATAANTFGTDFSSGELYFQGGARGGPAAGEEPKEKT